MFFPFLRKRPVDEITAVMRRVRRVDGVVMASNHVELGGDRLLWLHPSLAQPGDRVSVLRCGGELMVWSADPDPRLLAAHLPATATRGARSFARSIDAQVVGDGLGLAAGAKSAPGGGGMPDGLQRLADVAA